MIAADDGRVPIRRMRAETRSTLLTAIARARRWMQELASGAVPDANAIAEREGCSARQVAATLSLASLAPDLVEAAIAGRLPHGIGLRQLTDASLLWSRQRAAIGIRSPADL